ncbi:MAG: PEP-CTERM sorting domain-containing protein [Nitrospirales bacterium]|nr:PEP-CTERM sorting domain-containing protein [Nitrospirales bacterium]
MNRPMVHHAGGGWTSVLFPIFPGDLTALSQPSRGIIRCDVHAALPQPYCHIPGTIGHRRTGIDNISALYVPEPSTILLVGSGLLVSMGRGRRIR